jgi:hypothetical protein
MSQKLDSILEALTNVESQLVPVFIHNPNSQRIAAIAFVGQQVAFSLFQKLSEDHAAAPQTTFNRTPSPAEVLTEQSKQPPAGPAITVPLPHGPDAPPNAK